MERCKLGVMSFKMLLEDTRTTNIALRASFILDTMCIALENIRDELKIDPEELDDFSVCLLRNKLGCGKQPEVETMLKVLAEDMKSIVINTTIYLLQKITHPKCYKGSDYFEVFNTISKFSDIFYKVISAPPNNQVIETFDCLIDVAKSNVVFLASIENTPFPCPYPIKSRGYKDLAAQRQNGCCICMEKQIKWRDSSVLSGCCHSFCLACTVACFQDGWVVCNVKI